MDATDELRRAVNALPWIHTIELGHGIVTPGAWPPSPLILQILDTVDFRGKKVLDIGCWDGLWSFEAERRGAAEVFATDFSAHRPHREMPTFEIARRALNSKAHYFPNLSVYDVGELGVTDFDVVLFCGVYYHLKDPLLALARLRRVMRPGAILVVEGEALDDERASYARFFYRSEHAGDRSTWWVPTIACLREWVQCSFFEIVRLLNVAKDPLSGRPAELAKKWLKRRLVRRAATTRCALLARAVLGDDPRYPYPDEELGHLSAE